MQSLHRSIGAVTALLWLAVSNAAVLRGGSTDRRLQAFSVTDLKLILASSDQDMGAIQENQVVYLGDLPPGASFNIKAEVSGTPKSVRFSYNGNLTYWTENSAPYAFCGNAGSDYKACTVLGIGSHTVTATPYSDSLANGVSGTARTVSFTIVAGSAPKPPSSPVAAPAAVAPVAPPAAPAPSPAKCKVPQLVGTWKAATKYPIPSAEAQGGIVGKDLMVISGFTQGYGQATPECYALDLNVAGSAWRRMDDVPIAKGITHAAVVIDGLKLYMCGGFVGGHPGPHTDACFVYDHSIAPGSGKQWTALPPLPEGRSGGGLVKSKVRNALFYAGGAERPSASEYVDYPHTWMLPLDGSSGWKAMTDIPFLSNHMSYVTGVDHLGVEHSFFLGGQMGENEDDGNVDTNYEWDAVKEVWIQRQKMPFARGHASSSTRAISCGFIVIAGTTNESGKTKDISYYDIPSDTWTKVGELSAAINTPVCDIDFVNGYLYCETGWAEGRFSARVPIQV